MERSPWRGFLVVGLAATVGFLLLPAGGRAQGVVEVALNLGALVAIIVGVV